MNIAFLDVETTGLDPHENELLEVAFILRDDSPALANQEVYFSLEINEHRASERALKINRYHERRDELAAVQKVPEAAIASLALLQGALVVGNNVQFDLRFIEHYLRRWLSCSDQEAGMTTTPWYYSPLDLKSFVAGRCGMTKPASTKMIAEVAGVPLPADAHTALADAYWNQHVYDALQYASWRPVR